MNYTLPMNSRGHRGFVGFRVQDPTGQDKRAPLALRRASYDADHRPDAKTKERIAGLRFSVKGDKELPDILDGFTSADQLTPAVSAALVDGLRSVIGDVADFIPVPNLWDEHTDAPYEGPPYYFLNVLQWINGWDADRTDISAMYGKDGYMVAETLQSGTPVVNKDAVGDAVIWRDSRTRDLVIADPVKEVLETFDTASVWYRDLEI